jgi:hypothetical protein
MVAISSASPAARTPHQFSRWCGVPNVGARHVVTSTLRGSASHRRGRPSAASASMRMNSTVAGSAPRKWTRATEALHSAPLAELKRTKPGGVGMRPVRVLGASPEGGRWIPATARGVPSERVRPRRLDGGPPRQRSLQSSAYRHASDRTLLEPGGGMARSSGQGRLSALEAQGAEAEVGRGSGSGTPTP